MSKFFKFGDVHMEVPKKMIITNADGKQVLRNTLTKSNQLSTHLKKHSLKVVGVSNLQKPFLAGKKKADVSLKPKLKAKKAKGKK